MPLPDVKIPWRGSLTDLVTDLKSELTVRQWCDLAHLLRADPAAESIPLLLWCPECNERHVDRGAFETKSHHTHACQFCGHVWRPALVPTRGVQFLPGYRNEETASGFGLRASGSEPECLYCLRCAKPYGPGHKENCPERQT